MNIAAQLEKEFGFQTFQITNTLILFDEGATIPFIARYRKEKTGTLNEIEIRDLQHRYTYFTELEERRTTILDSIESQGKLTPELKKKIEDTISKIELEDLYLPYKPKRITRGKKATDAGLSPLARWLVDCDQTTAPVEDEAIKYKSDKATELGFDSNEKLIKGACDILAEELSDDAENRKWLRKLASKNGEAVCVVRKDFKEKKTKFNMYYDYKEPVKDAPSHRILAMLRGEREKVLRLEINFPKDQSIAYLEKRLIKHPGSATADYLAKTVEDCLNRLLSTATETEIRKELRERAETEALKVFGENMRTLLLSPPAGRKAIIGLDPGFRTGCKLVTLDNTGKLMVNHTIYPTEPRNDIEGSREILWAHIDKYAVELIAIGNGTASRETEKIVRNIIADIPQDKRPTVIIVNESGASVYSASEVAIKEFPNHDITVRGAVSIARRLQDPLSELVKIDPKSIGVGQYQHDINQTTLKNSLEEVVESSVNKVGVDLNLASEELLKYVAGLSKKIAGNVVEYRNKFGAFTSRKDVLKISGLGPKAYEQAAGFLRISNAKNPLDNSSVHPERYKFVAMMASELKSTVDNLIGNVSLLKSIDKSQFVSDNIGLPTINDIIKELEKPGRDPREQFSYAIFDDKINKITDLNSGMKLEGTVTNVTNFGAFVDIGVHQDGLVHISQIADRFVDDPTRVVKVGQVVKVTVLEIDEELKRISLSMKSNPDGKPQKPNKASAPNRKTNKPTSKKPQMSTADQLKQWSGQTDKKRPAKKIKLKFSMKDILKG